MAREKWTETVSYLCDDAKGIDANSDETSNELYAYNAPNGDLYFGVREKGHKIGKKVRLRRHGGVSFSNPRLLQALTLAYDAMANNENTLDKISGETDLFVKEEIDGKNIWQCKNCEYELPIIEDKAPIDFSVNYCPCCGFKIKKNW